MALDEERSSGDDSYSLSVIVLPMSETAAVHTTHLGPFYSPLFVISPLARTRACVYVVTGSIKRPQNRKRFYAAAVNYAGPNRPRLIAA